MSDATTSHWERRLSELVPLYGHRNWIVVADAAYPAQSKPGIETIVSGGDQIPVVRKVLDTIAAAKHIRANVYIDRELAFVTEPDAPGVQDFRQELDTVLLDADVDSLPHEQIIHKLDEAAQLVRILIIKTEMTIPYTSVFFELDCGYWNGDAEQRLREEIQASEAK
jgi:hypothetical protein